MWVACVISFDESHSHEKHFLLSTAAIRLTDRELYYRADGEEHSHSAGNDKHISESDNDSDKDDDDSHSQEIAVNSQISNAFSNKQSFSCPRAKPLLHTGESLADLSPEDIDIVAAMGDALTAGRGLWEGTDVEFRGAAFPIGGDATIDGLVTIPNILLEFNEKLAGVSHGMGKRLHLPDYQLNVAQSSTETEDLPEQKINIEDLESKKGPSGLPSLCVVFTPSCPRGELEEKWAFVTIATGTEEFCNHCDTPNHSSIRRALGILRKGIPKAFVVLLGPVHVASSYELHINLLRRYSQYSCHCDTPDYYSSRRALGILRNSIPKAVVVLLGPVHIASSYELHINLPRFSY
ncbi:hypothetical protein OSTOST_07778 [Ostertagia ostertagi]